jgi:hypothetical protein
MYCSAMKAIASYMTGLGLFVCIAAYTPSAEAMVDLKTAVFADVKVPYCDNRKACDKVAEEIKVKARKIAQKKAPAACDKKAAEFQWAKSSKVIYIKLREELSRFDRNTEIYHFRFDVTCRLLPY